MTFPVEIHFDPQDEEKIIRNETIKSIMEFQNLKEDDIDNIYNAVWGYILKYVPEKDRIHKGINSIIEAKLKTIVSGVGFINEDELQYSYFDVHLTAEWDMEHGRTVSYFNGKLDDVN